MSMDGLSVTSASKQWPLCISSRKLSVEHRREHIHSENSYLTIVLNCMYWLLLYLYDTAEYKRKVYLTFFQSGVYAGGMSERGCWPVIRTPLS